MKAIILFAVILLSPVASAQFCDDGAKQMADSLESTVNIMYGKSGYYEFDFVLFNFECFNNSLVGIRGYVDVSDNVIYSSEESKRNELFVEIDENCKFMNSGEEYGCRAGIVRSGVYNVIGRLEMDHPGPGNSLGRIHVTNLELAN